MSLLALAGSLTGVGLFIEHEGNPTMTVTVYVDGWHLTENSAQTADNNGDASTTRIPSQESTFPSLNLTTTNLGAVLRTIGSNHNPQCDDIEPCDVNDLQKKLMVAVNNSRGIKANTMAPEHSDRYFFGGVGVDSLHSKLVAMLDIARFAQSRGKGIYWA